MAAAVDQILAGGHELAQAYAAAVAELNRHWADQNGCCIGCPGEAYPCHLQWVTERRIVAIEVRWRRAGLALAAARG
jgi:hypothetical protein